MFKDGSEVLVEKWAPVLEGIDDEYVRKTTAMLLDNQAKSVLSEKEALEEEANSAGTTTVGKLGTFQKFAFPLVRRVYPELIFNKIGGVQPMQGPVSQIFYLGHTREYHAQGGSVQNIYSKYDLTYRSMVTSAIGSTGSDEGQFFPGNWQDNETDGSAGLDLDVDPLFDLSNVLSVGHGPASATFGGQIAAWPDSSTILGYNTSAGEDLCGVGIPEISFNIEQQPVMARTRKMRALWTLEAAQDLRAYHDLDLERELTELLSKEIQLEIDRELIEDMRNIAYDPANHTLGGWDRREWDLANSNNFPGGGRGQGVRDAIDRPDFIPVDFQYDFTSTANPSGTRSNVWAIDFTSSALPFAPQHVGHVYSNLLAVVNLASQDIYTTTHRGPGSWLLCAPIMAALLESAAKLEGGVKDSDGPTNMGKTNIEYRGKFAGKYDLFVDPLYPEDEIMIGYKGSNAMDSGFVYAPYIPIQQLPTITDPETFQPRKGILTRYGKAAITPEARFYRIIRVVGPTAGYLFTPFAKNTGGNAVHGLG